MNLLPLVTSHRRSSRSSAFTMIEIAISLAVIGFALVAIIGILPIGMNVQKENREETIIHQDATLFLDAIRNGANGFDDLTNYVLGITNAWTDFDTRTWPYKPVLSGVNWYTRTGSGPNSAVPDYFQLTNGSHIVGLLTTPKYLPVRDGFRSNYVAASVRSISGSAFEKFPQDNQVAQEMGLTYRLISEVINFGAPVPYTTNNNAWDPAWVDYGNYPTNSWEYYSKATYLTYATNVSRHLHDLRLIFRWPMLQDGSVAKNGGRQVFRTSIGGDLRATNDPTYSLTISNMWFFRPTTYSTNSL